MVTSNVMVSKDDGTKRPKDNLLYAASHNDLGMASRVINSDPTCINNTSELGMNALQISLVHLHEDIAFLLLEETSISTTHEDYYGRDSMQQALLFSSEKLCSLIDERWSKERYEKISSKDNNVTPINPSP